jgi:hypothetical protein
MSVRTLVGVVADKDGFAQRKELAPRKTNGWAPELRCRSWSLPSREYRDRQERVPVTLGHGGARVGKLQHLELDRQDRLVAVATVDADIVEFGDWFFSAGAKYRGDADSQFSGADIGREIELFELVLTRNPASISLRPPRRTRRRPHPVLRPAALARRAQPSRAVRTRRLVSRQGRAAHDSSR